MFRLFRHLTSLGFFGPIAGLFVLALGLTLLGVRSTSGAKPPAAGGDGQFIFRFDTVGDEQVWTDTLRLHEVIQSSVSPAVALSVGLKVDATVLPPNFLA